MRACNEINTMTVNSAEVVLRFYFAARFSPHRGYQTPLPAATDGQAADGGGEHISQCHTCGCCLCRLLVREGQVDGTQDEEKKEYLFFS